MIEEIPTTAAGSSLSAQIVSLLVGGGVGVALLYFFGKEAWEAVKSWYTGRKAKKKDRETAEREAMPGVMAEKRSDIQLLIDELKNRITAITTECSGLKISLKDALGQIEELHKKADSLTLHAQISERIQRQINRQFSAALDELRVAYWEIDSTGKFCHANNSFFDVTGIDPEIDTDQLDWLSAVAAADRPRVARSWTRFKSNDEARFDFKFSFENIDTGRITQVAATVQTVYAEGMEVHKYTARSRSLAPEA